MNTFQVISFAVLSLAVMSHVASCWDQGLRDYILNIHNEMRKRPRACEMNKMEYDMDLENQARGWAQRCAFHHEMKPNRGENLAFSTMKQDDKQLIDTATDSWYDEIHQYSYGQRSCANSCHYTQLVWSNTKKVGCYAHQCPMLSGGAANAWFLVCFYTPMGNWSGEKPYKTSCPAKCAKGQTEEGGLCIGEAKKDCKDSTPRCVGWASRGECKRNPNYMNSKCAKSCKTC